MRRPAGPPAEAGGRGGIASACAWARSASGSKGRGRRTGASHVVSGVSSGLGRQPVDDLGPSRPAGDRALGRRGPHHRLAAAGLELPRRQAAGECLPALVRTRTRRVGPGRAVEQVEEGVDGGVGLGRQQHRLVPGQGVAGEAAMVCDCPSLERPDEGERVVAAAAGPPPAGRG